MTPAELRELALVCREMGVRRVVVSGDLVDLTFVRLPVSPIAASVTPPATAINADEERESKRRARERYLEAMESAHTSGRGWPSPADYGLTEAEVS